MKTIIKGQIVNNEYSVNENTKIIKDGNGKEKEIFIGKPELHVELGETEWEKILEFEGEPYYNQSFGNSIGSLNISENETVLITEQIFRADLNEIHLKTNKVIKENNKNKSDSEVKLEECIKRFNKEMIESNDKMKDYCEVHNLNPSNTDCIKLFNIVYPNREYDIVDGKMICKNDRKFLEFDNKKISGLENKIKDSHFISYGRVFINDQGQLIYE